MIATDRPTFTHRLTDSERRAFSRAIHGGLAAKVIRQAAGRYLVPSTSSSDVYAVWQDEAGRLHCPCIAGSLGRLCRHVCAVRLRKTQEDARAQAKRLAQASVVPAPTTILAPTTLPATKRQPLRRVELV